MEDKNKNCVNCGINFEQNDISVNDGNMHANR